MLELFIANKNYSSWSLRPWVLMRELQIPFEEKLVPFVDKGEPSPFLAFSPSGKVPCLATRTTKPKRAEREPCYRTCARSQPDPGMTGYR